MEIKILDQKPSQFLRFMAELRDERIQKDSMRFRENLRRIGRVFAFEISKELPFHEITVYGRPRSAAGYGPAW